MRIVIFATRFQGGTWKDWEHLCDDNEAAAVMNSAVATAFDRGFSQRKIHSDYLQGARYIFDVACGLPDAPKEGDTQVRGISVDEIALKPQEDLERHFAHR
ncbi:MAG TPA: hypothetical protein VGN01_20390 [Acidobacteriaceae bacterium]|jgi:hypothetical protein